MEFEYGSFKTAADKTNFYRRGSYSRNRVLLREPEKCLRCAKRFLSLYPLSDCSEHEGLDAI